MIALLFGGATYDIGVVLADEGRMTTPLVHLAGPDAAPAPFLARQHGAFI